MSRKFCLLVGVDFYPTNNARTNKDGEFVTLKDLRGCVNDVNNLQDYITTTYGPHIAESCVLTSSTSAEDPTQPREAPDRHATFRNIEQGFKRIYNQASAGDLFYFHFSGHGARLARICTSPGGRLIDPSLLPADYCCGQPALRGWLLNEWLKKLYEKRVTSFVTLDSCYSGESWRGKYIRSPPDWVIPVNLPADEAAGGSFAGGVQDDDRALKAVESWDINPGGFTLMTACSALQMAEERLIDGRVQGVYTNALVSYLRENTARLLTYRILHDNLHARVSTQTPQLYGQDRLVCFGSIEPVLPVPLVARIDGSDVVLPVGRVHAVTKGTEFIVYPPSSEKILSVNRVEETRCRAMILQQERLRLSTQFEVFVSRWSSPTPFDIHVHESLGSIFRDELRECLERRISSSIRITTHTAADSEDQKCLTLSSRDTGPLHISGPSSLTGYTGSIPFLEIPEGDAEEKASKSALMLTHLFRFQQVLVLREAASTDAPPFSVSLEQEKPTRLQLMDKARVEEGAVLRVSIRNLDNNALYVTIMNFGPCFHIRQIYPVSESAHRIAPRDGMSICFGGSLPDKLGSGYHRDIIRVVVTKGAALSMSTLQLPDIWDAGQMKGMTEYEPERHARMMGRTQWWIKDVDIWTQRSRNDA